MTHGCDFLVLQSGNSIIFFTWPMIMYDDTPTYKPEWKEWLGRLEKWRSLFQGNSRASEMVGIKYI